MEIIHEPIEVDYAAVFNPDDGSILSIGPKELLFTEQNKIPVDAEIVERINKGELRIQSCFLDIDTGSLEIAETKNLFKIDDVLHRVPYYKDVKEEQPDVYIQFCAKTRMLTFSLHKKWGGSYGSLKNNQKTAKIVWSGDTVLDFLITKRNDPNIIYDKFSCSIDNLVDNIIAYELSLEFTSFSVYTKRIMKKYALEIV